MTDIRKRFHRWTLSVMAGMFAAILLTGTGGNFGQTNVTAWWGSIYPAFCFSEIDKSEQPKISFWLAKAFERW